METLTAEDYNTIVAALMTYKEKLDSQGLNNCLRIANKIQDMGYAPHWAIAKAK